MNRLNLGCGSIQPEGWVNADVRDLGQGLLIDILSPEWDLTHWPNERFDYIVANHLLSCFSHWELIDPVLPRIRSMLADGGVFRALVPDARAAARALLYETPEWFPQGPDLPGTDERFCTFLPWFGESTSIFTGPYLMDLGITAGFRDAKRVKGGRTHFTAIYSGITDLDDRLGQALIMEFLK